MEITGNPLEIFLVFWSGVLVSFTPCVYPILPITASFIAGANTRGTKMMGFTISLFYVFGVALTYSALAVFAALTGKLFGSFQNNPYVFLVVANVLIFFALVMLDVITLPTISMGKQQHKKPRNVWAVILFGAASGLIVGPCLSPVLGALLAFVAGKQNVLYGVLLMFVFAYGMGTSLILVGTFSGLLGNLPKSGMWLVRIKQLCGIILIIAAQYYLVKAGGLF